MRDSIQQNVLDIADIPDSATRVTYLIAIIFMIVIAIVLGYFKMKESDERLGI